MVVNLLASPFGTLSLGIIDVAAATPLLLAAAAVALSAVPIAFGRMPRPPIRPALRPRLGGLIRRSPLGKFGCIGAGVITGVLGVILLSLLVCAPLALMPQRPPAALIGLMGAFGFAQYPIYGLCVGIANREAPDRPAAHIAGALVFLLSDVSQKLAEV